MNEFICKYCGKKCKKYGLRSHEWLRHEAESCSPNKGKAPWNKGLSSWSKGLTKETDERVKRNAQKVSKALIGKKGHSMSNENKKKLSIRQSLHNIGGRCKWYSVGKQKVQGTWERDLARLMKKLCIDWEKIKTNNHIYTYIDNNKVRSYAPDFYLKEIDKYLEVKGFWWGNDKDKMKKILEQSELLKEKLIILEKEAFYSILNSKNKGEFYANVADLVKALD